MSARAVAAVRRHHSIVTPPSAKGTSTPHVRKMTIPATAAISQGPPLSERSASTAASSTPNPAKGRAVSG